MFKLINRYRRGVSPVIAVVLLIALTVAAVAVIWAITQGLLSGGTVTLNYRDASGAVTDSNSPTVTQDILTVNVILSASEGTTLDSVTVQGDISGALTATTTVLTTGENDETFVFTGANIEFAGSSYEIVIEFSGESGSAQILKFTVNV